MSDPALTSLREPQSVARLSHTFSRSLSAADLVEPLASLDENQPMAHASELMRARSLSVLGVRRAGLVTGWVGSGDLTGQTLGKVARSFRPNEVLDEFASLDAVLGAFVAADHLFINWRGDIAGVITRRDLQKPPLRMWLFGTITVLDTNLTWAVTKRYPDDSWRNQLTPGRLAKAVQLWEERKRRGSECALIDCLQVKDKADIVMTDPASLSLLGLASRREADRLTRDVEKLRNHLAHAQELEAEHLATAARLAASIHTILRAEVSQRLVTADHSPKADSP